MFENLITDDENSIVLQGKILPRTKEKWEHFATGKLNVGSD